MQIMQKTLGVILGITLCAALAAPSLAETGTAAQTAPQAEQTAQTAYGRFAGGGKTGRQGGGFGATDRGGLENRLQPGQLPERGMRGMPGQAAELTDTQKEALKQAKTDQAAAYRAYLEKLRDAGILQQAELDAYDHITALQKVAGDIDTMQWTMQQNVDLRQALVKTGEDRKAAVNAFVTQGLLTQAQADALLAVSGNGGIDFSDWTVAQVRDLQAALQKPGADRVAAVQDAASKGLLTQTEADMLLCQRMQVSGERVRGEGSMTAEQQSALEAAQKELQDAYQKIRETLNASSL